MQAGLRETTVMVDFVNPPKEGSATGSIKANDGNYYRVKPELLDIFQKGCIYEIEYRSSEYPKGSGKMMHFLETARDANGIAVTPQKRESLPPKSTQQAYAKQAAGGSNLDACICGLLKSFIEAGKVDLNPASIAKAKKICSTGWLDEMNDEIGF